MPMESETSGDTAMSGQDSASQQGGAETAANAATGTDQAAGESSMTADASASGTPLERAEMALAKGDEEACMAAIEEAKAAKAQ